jgi:hypothetical protein
MNVYMNIIFITILLLNFNLTEITKQKKSLDTHTANNCDMPCINALW